MKEKRVFFKSQSLEIEGLMDETSGQKAVIMTHPHPLYGGEMHNNVVESVIKAYGQKGYTTLRFNFRGAGESQGSYDNGAGEQEDVKGAVAYLCERGKTSIDLAGYSFGAWVNALCVGGLGNVKRMLMVSPPVNFIDFSFLQYSPKVRLVIAGSQDDIAPPSMIREMMPRWNPDAAFKIIQGADHFYFGKTGELEGMIKDSLDFREQGATVA